MEALFQDLRFALRHLRKAPGFTLTAVLTLAFGIGATTAIFSIVEGVLLRPLPFPAQSNLVMLGDQFDSTGADALPIPAVEAAEIATYRREMHGFSSLGAYTQTTYELSGIGEPAEINASRLTADVFPILSVSPVLGRTFTAEDENQRQQLTVLSYDTWRTRFHGDPNILGQKILLERKPYEVIGVMPRQFEFPLVPGQLNRSELWIPMSLTESEITHIGSWNYNMIGRLRPGVSVAQVQGEANLVTDAIMRGFPAVMASLRIHAVVQRLDENTVAEARPLVRTLLLAVTVVLFIACANLAGLLLVRVIRRRREIAVRLALGASAAGVVRQALIETLTLSLAGGLLGLGLASVALRIGVRFLPETLPRVSSIGLDWQVVGFALLLAVLTGVVCGVVPALAASRTPVNDTLKEGGRTGSAGGGHARLRSALVIAEVSVALVLLVASGLLLRSFQKLRAVDLGFRADHTLTATYSLPKEQYSSQASVDQFNDRLLRQLQQIPGVRTVGITSQLPATGQANTGAFVTEGYAGPQTANMTLGWNSQVLGDYLPAVGIPLLRGRQFTDADRAGSPLVAIVNKTLADHYWPGQDPIGRRLHWGLRETPTPWIVVVGEIADMKQTLRDAPTTDQIYQPASQYSGSLGLFVPPDFLNGNGGSIVLRTALPPDQMADALRSTVRALDPRLPLTQVESMERVVDEGQAPRRFNTALISAFAAAAVLLAFLGIYGIIAFSATLRTQEMAIRLALGSQRSSVMRLILFSGARLGLIGCAIGAVVAFFATRLLRTFLFQVDPLDPTVLILAALAIFLLAIAASLLPARRVAYVEPTQALRAE
jgi:putative ABC transport system permease protein